MIRRSRFAICGLFILALVSTVCADERPLDVYNRVEIAPTKTSIYIGNVSLTMPMFQRSGITYSSTYVAKVFPYFFQNENGELSIDLPDEELRRLERGEVVHFVGRGKNTDGEDRRIEGRAIPTDSQSGKIKVRVFVSKKIQLIFNTTYRFPAVK
jgi:hypothetical protein